ncbi:putative RING/U-box superfamily protein [Melia azedarach]|uniref:RING/U-box superfamily protein n=1 Tax=Melia azedarach TaxID=155640 RepID=A0ACC1Z0V6_MELAZ|nr:putative RING/U-box superfamily protein [Melia azedarach]
MSTISERRDSLAGLTLDAILSDKRPMPPPPPPPSSRTLLDIIRDEDPNGKSFGQKDRMSWKLFRDRLRLKRAGAAWTSSVRVPASDIPIQSGSVHNPRSQLSRRSSVRYQSNPSSNNSSTESAPDVTQPEHSAAPTNARPQFTRRSSVRIVPPPPLPSESTPNEDAPNIPMPADAPPSRSFRPQISRHNSTRLLASNQDSEDNSVDPFEVAREGTRRLAVALAEERSLSAREAVAAQEAAEAEAAAAAAAAEAEESESATPTATGTTGDAAPGRAEPAPVRMSLMDLLEETDRQMGLEGSRYTMAADDEEEEEEEEEEDEEEAAAAEDVGGIEYNCCVCMVRHKGAAFIPCGHTFCRLCSRELWVQRGNCPLCNGFILEILDIF